MGQFAALVRKDLLLLFRSGGVSVSLFAFALLLVVASSFAFRYPGISDGEKMLLFPGILWLVFLFSAVVALNQSAQFEREDESCTAVMLATAWGSAPYLSKLVVNFLWLGAVQVLSFLALALFFGVPLTSNTVPILYFTLIAGFGALALGTLLSFVSAVSPSKDLLLPLILFPLLLPLTAAVIELGQSVTQTGALSLSSFPFVFLLVFDLIAVVISVVMFEFVVEG